MASTIGGSLFAAAAFSGTGYYFFHLLDKGEYSSEMKRHNLPMENLSKAREAWYEEEINLSTVDKALDAIRTITLTYHEENGRKRTFTRTPELRGFYRPSTEMKYYQNLATGVFGVGSGMILGFLI